MPKFMSKPRVIEAEQYTGPPEVPVEPYSEELPPFPKGVQWKVCGNVMKPFVTTIHDQDVFLATGTWVVPESDGKHYYPVTAEEMLARYDRMPGSESVMLTSRQMGKTEMLEALGKHPNLIGELTEALHEPITDRTCAWCHKPYVEATARAELQQGSGPGWEKYDPQHFCSIKCGDAHINTTRRAVPLAVTVPAPGFAGLNPFPRRIARWVLKHEQFGTYYQADPVVIGKYHSVKEIELCTWYTSEERAERIRERLEPEWRVLPVTVAFSNHDVQFGTTDVELPRHANAEQLQVQLAGVLVAAEGGTKDPVVAYQGQYGWSPAYQAVLDLRRKYDQIAPLHAEGVSPAPLRTHVLNEVMRRWGFNTREELRKHGDIANDTAKWQIAALIEEIFRLKECYAALDERADKMSDDLEVAREFKEGDEVFTAALAKHLGCEQDYTIILETLKARLAIRQRQPHEGNTAVANALRKARKALQAIYLEVPEAIAKDLHNVMEEAFNLLAYSDEIEKNLPRRIKLKENYDANRKFDSSNRYAVYFPGTDLMVTDMGGRGSGADPHEWGDYIDPEPEHLQAQRDQKIRHAKRPKGISYRLWELIRLARPLCFKRLMEHPEPLEVEIVDTNDPPRIRLAFPQFTPSFTIAPDLPMSDEAIGEKMKELQNRLAAEGWDRALDSAAPCIVLDGNKEHWNRSPPYHPDRSPYDPTPEELEAAGVRPCPSPEPHTPST